MGCCEGMENVCVLGGGGRFGWGRGVFWVDWFEVCVIGVFEECGEFEVDYVEVVVGVVVGDVVYEGVFMVYVEVCEFGVEFFYVVFVEVCDDVVVVGGYDFEKFGVDFE